MSLIIKGMDMPKKGVYYAVISFDGDSLSIRIPPSKKPFFDGRIEEIPTPHGRLIDDFKLLRALIKTFPNQSMNFYDTFERVIEEAPTIIEAEVSE